MKLYTYDKAPNPRRLQLFLQYKGIALATESVDLMTLEQHSDAFVTINPYRTVPALVLEDGSVMTEVIGICWYLECLHPERPLLGRTAREQAEVLSWDHRIFMHVFMPIAEMLRNGHPNFRDRALPGPEPVAQMPELVERGRARFRSYLPTLNQHLAGRPFLIGSQFTQADIDLLCALGFARWVKEEVPDSCGNVLAWVERSQQEIPAQ